MMSRSRESSASSSSSLPFFVCVSLGYFEQLDQSFQSGAFLLDVFEVCLAVSQLQDRCFEFQTLVAFLVFAQLQGPDKITID